MTAHERTLTRPRRTPLTWVRGGGLSSLLFLAPMLVIFGIFSWWPIVRSVVMSFQHTNLVTAPTWVGFDNFVQVVNDPLFWTAVGNTAWFALLALVLGKPAPHAVRLSHRKRVRRALRAHRAPHADLLGRVLASTPGRTALALRMEEKRAVHPATGGQKLPVPQVRVRSGKAGEICHCVTPCSRSGRIRCPRPYIYDLRR